MNENNKGTLYLVPTPIGNLEDMTYRAVRILGEVDAIAAEDTRHTGILLKHFEISKPLISYHEHNKEEKGNAIAQDISVVPLPGANAALTALIASDLDTKQFTFFGFLPKRGKHRNDALQLMAKQRGTLLFYEAPHRLQEVLCDMYEAFGNRPITIAREVTKKFETFLRSDLASICDDLDQIIYKGEFVLVIGGCETGEPSDDKEEQPISYEEAVAELVETGMPKKEAIREVAKRFGVSRREVYNIVER